LFLNPVSHVSILAVTLNLENNLLLLMAIIPVPLLPITYLEQFLRLLITTDLRYRDPGLQLVDQHIFGSDANDLGIDGLMLRD
jgi:hypothetical protein